MDVSNRFKGSLMGMAVGDAYGTTFEFIPRHGIKPEQLFNDDFMGGGPFKLMKGMFTDDTSLALIQAESLLDFYTIDQHDEILERLRKLLTDDKQELETVNENNTCLRGNDIIHKSLRWYRDGHFSAEGSCFDIGMTTLTYLQKNERDKLGFCKESDKHDRASGNGALMRLATVPLYFYGLYLRKKENKADYECSHLLHRVIEESGFSSMTTHPSQIAIDCNRYMAALLIGCLQDATKEQLLSPLFVPKGLPENYWEIFPLRHEVTDIVERCGYKTATRDDIKNSGYSVGAFNSALWAFYNFDNYMDGLMEIVKLGDDSDTVGAIYGQLAGCYYGIEGIPNKLVNQCVYSKFICLIADELLRAPRKIGENSWAYINVMKIFQVLEDKYLSIHRYSKPCPKQFKSIDEFNNSVEEMKKAFSDLKGSILDHSSQIDKSSIELFTTVVDSLLDDFLKRCSEYTVKELEGRINLKQQQASIFPKLKK